MTNNPYLKIFVWKGISGFYRVDVNPCNHFCFADGKTQAKTTSSCKSISVLLVFLNDHVAAFE